MPLACGQLLHAFVFDRDCFPDAYGNFILARSPGYIHPAPPHYPTPALTTASKTTTTMTAPPWPSTTTVVDALAQISTLKWPRYTSPILYPTAPLTSLLPPHLPQISPLTSPAHPGLQNLSCALLHPSDPSCARTSLRHILAAFPSTLRFFTVFYTLLALLFRPRALLATNPARELLALAKRSLRTTTFITAAIATSWSSVCAWQRILPGSVLSTQRWFLGGFAGGMWAYLEREGGKGSFMYSARASVDSAWKVGRKRGWWRGVSGGDVGLFMLAMAVVGWVYEARPGAVEGAWVRRGLGVARGEGWVDRAAGGVSGEKGTGRGKRQTDEEEEKEEEVDGSRTDEAMFTTKEE